MNMENTLILGICDDDFKMRQRIHKICQDVLNIPKNNFICVHFKDGSEVLQYSKKIDLLILDIKMAEIDGFTVRQRIEEREEKTVIIFVTEYDDLMEDSFGINVHGFVPKHSLETKLKPILLSALKAILRPFVILEGNIDSRTILFIKAEAPYCRIYFQDSHEELFRRSISGLAENLKNVDFIRVHRSYLVNLRWIDKVPEQDIEILGYNIPVARRLRVEIKKVYRDYARNYARYC